MYAGAQELHPLGHIDGVVGEAFQILGDHEQVQRGLGAGGVGGDGLGDLGGKAGEAGVHLIVPCDDLRRGGQIHLYVGAHRLLDHGQRHRAHGLQVLHHMAHRDGTVGVQMQHDLGNIAGLVSDALDVGDHLEGGGHLAQVPRHRLLAQKQRQAAVLDFMLRGVDLAVPRNDAAGQFKVVGAQRREGVVDGRPRRVAHPGQQGIQLQKRGVIFSA